MNRRSFFKVAVSHAVLFHRIKCTSGHIGDALVETLRDRFQLDLSFQCGSTLTDILLIVLHLETVAHLGDLHCLVAFVTQVIGGVKVDSVF